MTVKELMDALHQRVLHSFTRGNTITGFDAQHNPIETGDHTDHWSREATEEDVKKISADVAALATKLQKGE